MKDIKDCENCNSVELGEEIRERRELHRQMVGSLYPSILVTEILRLIELKEVAEINERIEAENERKRRRKEENPSMIDNEEP